MRNRGRFRLSPRIETLDHRLAPATASSLSMTVALTASATPSKPVVSVRIEPPTLLVLAPKIIAPAPAQIVMPNVPE